VFSIIDQFEKGLVDGLSHIFTDSNEQETESRRQRFDELGDIVGNFTGNALDSYFAEDLKNEASRVDGIPKA